MDQENKPINVVVIEDNPGDARLIAEMLKENGAQAFHLTQFSLLQEAYAQIDPTSTDVILLDLGLPDSQGMETFAHMHGYFPNIPIIVLTGNIDQQTATKAVREGAQDYLIKGDIDGDLLIRAIRYAIERAQTLAALAKEKAELSALIYNIGDAVIATDTNCIVTRFNPIAAFLTGYSEAEAKGKLLNKVFKLVGQELHKNIECPIKQILETGKVSVQTEQLFLVSRDGSKVSISNTVSLVTDPNGKTIGAVLVFHDDTDQRISQRLLQVRFNLIEFAAAHTLNELLTEALDQISALVDSPIGFYHFVDADQMALTLQEWSTRTKDTFCQAQPEQSHYSVTEAGVWADCIRQKKAIIHNEYASLPNKKGMPEGHAQLIRELFVPVMRENHVVAVLGVGNKPFDYTLKDIEITSYLADVTWHIVDQKRAEEKLQESEKQYRQIVETAEEGIWLTNAENQIIFANQKMAHMLQYEVEDLLNTPESNYYFEDDLDFVKEKLKNRRAGIKESYETRFRRRDDSTVWAIVNAVPIQNDKSTFMGSLVMVSDISERKAVERQVERERDRAQTYFSIAGAILLVLDKAGTILQINQKGLQVLEYGSADELLGKNWFETCIPQEIQQEMRAIHQKNVNPAVKNVAYHENAVLTKAGKKRMVAWNNTSLVEMGENQVYGVLSSGEDITERVLTQREIEMLLTLSRKAGSVDNLDDLLFLITNQIVEVIPGADAATTFLYDQEKEVVSIQAWAGYNASDVEGMDFPTTKGQIKRIFRTKQPEIINNTAADKTFIRINKPHISKIKSHCAVPLIFAERVIGIIFADNLNKTEAFSKKDTDLLESIANQLAGEVQNTRLLDQVRQQRQQLQNERDKAQKYLDIAAVMITALDTEGNITLINQKGAQVLGYEINELIGQNWFTTCVPAHDAARARHDFDEFIAGEGQPGVHYEQTLITKDGKEILSKRVSIAIHDDNKKVIGVLSSGEDITEQKQTQKALRTNELRLRNIFENSTNMFYAHTLEKVFTFVSPQSKQILGYEPGELVNKPTKILVDLPINEEPLKNTDKAIQTGLHQPPFEIQLRTKHGDLVWVEVREAPVLVNGKTVSIVGSLNDITERKAAELEREQNLVALQIANEDLQSSYNRVQNTMEATIRTIARTVEVRDPYTAGHHQRVSALAVAIAQKMELDEESIKAIELAGMIHDLGKIQVPAEILSKPGKLTDIEFSLVKTHPTIGYELLKSIEFPWPLADIIRQHHEKMDGSGYPLGLKGNQISLEGRILVVADTVEAMSSHRPYRPALGIDVALNQIKLDRATLYDVDVVDACLRLFESGYQLPTI